MCSLFSYGAHTEAEQTLFGVADELLTVSRGYINKVVMKHIYVIFYSQTVASGVVIGSQSAGSYETVLSSTLTRVHGYKTPPPLAPPKPQNTS